MKANKAIRQIMRNKKVSLVTMAKLIGKRRPNDVSARLVNSNMRIDTIIEMLDVLGYEIIVQEKRGGMRRTDSIVITSSKEEDTAE